LLKKEVRSEKKDKNGEKGTCVCVKIKIPFNQSAYKKNKIKQKGK
jgi:hypothetical protein